MATPVEMPQLGNTVEECIVSRWIKKEGDTVSAGETLAEIETDKTTFEVAAPVSGTVLATFCEEGAAVRVFTTICVLGAPGENIDAHRPGQAAAQGVRSATATSARQPAEAAAPRVAQRSERGATSLPAFSPRARRFAAARNFHPAAIAGSGPGGRVLEQDVRNAYERRSEPGRSAGPRNAVSGLRATIARRMRESVATTAQYTLNSSAAATALLALRRRVKSRASEGALDVTINELVTFCAIQTLLELPDLNAEFIDGRILPHADVHIAFAVDTPRGLLAPVVRRAQLMDVARLSLRMKELSTEAIEGTIAADDLTGATFTISNLGSLGIESFTPLLNPPQVAVLGVGAIQLKPIRRPVPPAAVRMRETSARRAMAWAESIEFVDSIGFSLTCDHQVIDGAPGARFLQALGRKVETIDTICEI